MFFSTAGNTVAGCSTFAPKYANSAASSKLMILMRCASGQIRGSVVFIPSTSVQISIASASSPAPASAAEKSDPPRPMVVVIPARRANEPAHHRHLAVRDQRAAREPAIVAINLFHLRNRPHVLHGQ